jgi:hypothetical protein
MMAASAKEMTVAAKALLSASEEEIGWRRNLAAAKAAK